MRSRFPVYLVVAVPLLCALTILAYNLPPIHERLAWRVDDIRSRIKYAINPPEEVVFVPQEQTPQATPLPFTHTPSPTPTATLPGPTPTPQPSLTQTLTPTAIPASMRLAGITHEYQKWNNCGPATLGMALSFWDWQGDGVGDLQTEIAAYVKPNERDKNVMPYEMETFVEEETGLQAVVRVGGDLDMLKKLIAAGYPVMVEKGFEPEAKLGWMGHYEVLSGYDDAKGHFIAQDSYIMPNLPVPYDEIETYWRHFNNTYLVIYPAEREGEVMSILGAQADETYNAQYAAQLASEEIYSLSGRDQFFAWYNRGTNLVKLQDYAGAAAAYDEAFAIYPSIPEDMRPWRALWYQTGPYFAYFYSGRYNDVINLATTTITVANEPSIEESFYWRAMARAAVGDTAGAIEDFKTSLEWHPGFEPSLYQLELLGVEP